MDKKTLSAFGLIFLVIMAYQYLILPRVMPPPPPPAVDAPAGAPSDSVVPSAPPVPAETTVALPEDLPQQEPPPPPAERVELPVSRPLYTAVLDSQRGGIRSWKIPGYVYPEKTEDVGGEPVELIEPRPGAGALGLVFSDALLEASFSSPLTLEERDGEAVLSGIDPYGLLVKRVYRFNPENYDVEMDLVFENRSERPRSISWEISLGPDLLRHRTSDRTDQPAAVKYLNGEVDTLKVRSPGEGHGVGPVGWIGIGDRYFLTALAVREGSLAGFVRKDAESRLEVGLRAESFTLMPRQLITYRLVSYFGPKEQARLSTYGIGLERSVNYGWFSWLALPFLSIMKFFYRYLQNWGLAILALTLLVKLVLFPISQTMYRSMRKMQSLQPQIQALKKKYKDDSQALQRETMALYRQYKVNPMAGCLPMFVQIPVFFALYRVLYNAIELRGASFLYIPDLSQKDPYYITPLLMGATMILQQRLSPTSGDPKQAKMMMFMPIIFTAMFLNFSSGLVLYFLFSNVLSIGEQFLVRRWTGTLSPAVHAGKKKP